MTEEEKLKTPAAWQKWGPYLSERQWATIREDYSADGDAWNFVSHEMARSKAYRWGEEGIAGISDDKQHLCLSLALWNGQDPMLKERLFGLTNSEGNHGEDVKELYYYLDNTPSHSYMNMLYKYPHRAFPYEQLRTENAKRTRNDPEFELIDTGIFNESKYFDVFIEYAKNSETDILICYSIYNRAGEDAVLHVLPTVWHRNLQEWGDESHRPSINIAENNSLLLDTKHIGEYHLYADGAPVFLFTENETNNEQLYGSSNKTAHLKDGINERVVNGRKDAVNVDGAGTKAAAWYQIKIAAGGKENIRLRLSKKEQPAPFEQFEQIVERERKNADDFYANKIDPEDPAKAKVQRQAYAGMLWNKQFYYFNVHQWLKGDPGEPAPPEGHKTSRNTDWKHLMAADIISMPDKWEYPWFAAWDLAFHCIVFAEIDPGFAKKQLLLLMQDRYMHPDGHIPAYEWNFSDVNPPVQALAAWKVYKKDEAINGTADREFLEKIFHRLMINFTWWVNRKDSEGNNIFEGGFLGLDNIGVFDRSRPLPDGTKLEQADGTSWMAMYALNMLRIAMELALKDIVYIDMAKKFAEHFFYIAGAMTNIGNKAGRGLWDDEDSFFYDVLKLPGNNIVRLRLRTIAGLIPLFAVEVIDDAKWHELPELEAHVRWFLSQRPDLAALVSNWEDKSGDDKHLFSLLRGHRMKCLLHRMLDENEFLSPYGIRSVSKIYSDHPYDYVLNGSDHSVHYTPGESDSGMFGGNSNWRGPVWLPLNYLLIESLYRFHDYYSDDFKVEYPTGAGNYFSLKAIADSLSGRLCNLFIPDPGGQRPSAGENEIVQRDEYFKDHILFYEYFHGDTGKGLGASHQTGWTGLVALLMRGEMTDGR